MRDVEEAYWDQYYRKASAPKIPSQFAAFIVNELAPATVVDVGCGNGRDAHFFAAHVDTVLGFDRSQAAIDMCASAAAGAQNAAFRCCPVSDPAWAAAAEAARTDGPLLVYARFVLHALSEDEEEDLLRATGELISREADRFAVEFRTHLDHGRPKVTGSHFRRFIDPSVLVYRAAKRGLRPTYSVQGFGMAKYRDDDAHVARIIFERDR